MSVNQMGNNTSLSHFTLTQRGADGGKSLWAAQHVCTCNWVAGPQLRILEKTNGSELRFRAELTEGGAERLELTRA